MDPDNTSKRMLADNKDFDTWVCILQAGICGVNAIEHISEDFRGWAKSYDAHGGSCGNSSIRQFILNEFLQHGHDFISRYPDKMVKQQERPDVTLFGQLESSTGVLISVRDKAHQLFETIIAFVLRTLPIYPIMIPQVPGLMWFGRSSPWEHRLSQDIDVLGAADQHQ